MENRNSNPSLLLFKLQRLPDELLYKIFSYLPKRSVPVELFDSAYFVRRWQVQHEVEAVRVCSDKRTMVLVDGVLTQTIWKSGDKVITDIYDDSGEVVKREMRHLEEDSPLLRCTGMHKGRLHGDYIVWSDTGEVVDHYIFENNELARIVTELNGEQRFVPRRGAASWKSRISSVLDLLRVLKSVMTDD